ncbi:hypothetical protein C8R48DRAFT_680087 [Suillus tomentosus]|nr:hypothetical protein C8R48DRAFT_782670 [Suillus tomentosus]KAG1838493.1 hypothetical protein C8R48DRAFT_680087 [Suillus tomentosus]
MPPCLKDGQPLGQKFLLPPSTQKLCVCAECFPETSIDLVTGFPVRGKYIGAKEHAAHQRREAKRGLAPAEATPTEVPRVLHAVSLSGQLPPAHSTLDIREGSGLCFKVNSSSLQFDESGDMEDLSSSKSTYVDLLHHFEDKLKSSRIQDFVASGLVFVDPPEASSTCPPVVEHLPNIEQFVNTGRFTIDDAHPANSQMIGYEGWLFESYQVAKDGSKHPDVDIRLRSKAAQKALRNKLIIITELKSAEWKCQL